MRRASIFTRFLALFIDLAILFLCHMAILFCTVSGYLASGNTLSFSKIFVLGTVFVLASSFISLFYFTYLTMRGGATVGKRIFSVKVVRPDGAEVNLLRALVRAIAYILSASIWCIGFFMAFFLKGKTLHDMIADTRVVKGEI